MDMNNIKHAATFNEESDVWECEELRIYSHNGLHWVDSRTGLPAKSPSMIRLFGGPRIIKES
jgi:hypothetical protein